MIGNGGDATKNSDVRLTGAGAGTVGVSTRAICTPRRPARPPAPLSCPERLSNEFGSLSRLPPRQGVALPPDGSMQLFTCSVDKTLKLWDLGKLAFVDTLSAYPSLPPPHPHPHPYPCPSRSLPGTCAFGSFSARALPECTPPPPACLWCIPSACTPPLPRGASGPYGLGGSYSKARFLSSLAVPWPRWGLACPTNSSVHRTSSTQESCLTPGNASPRAWALCCCLTMLHARCLPCHIVPSIAIVFGVVLPTTLPSLCSASSPAPRCPSVSLCLRGPLPLPPFLCQIWACRRDSRD